MINTIIHRLIAAPTSLVAAPTSLVDAAIQGKNNNLYLFFLIDYGLAVLITCQIKFPWKPPLRM